MKLDYRVIHDAKVQAYIFPIVRYPDGFRGGPVLSDEADQHLRHTRGRKPYDSFREDVAYETRLSGDYTLSGPIDGHFGHFMAEMVHRVLPSKQLGLKNPFILITSQDWSPQPTYAHFPSHVKEALHFLELSENDVTLVKHNTVIERLHIVEAGSDLDGGPKPGYTDILRGFTEHRLDELHGNTRRPKKLYVSRSSLTPQGLILGETYLEAELEKEGFTIFRPEEFRFTPQMDFYRKAEIIIFPEGSACHGTELLGTGMMNRAFILPRRYNSSISPFSSILSPRSKSIEVMVNCVEYLGTTSAHPRLGSPLSNTGAFWLNIETIASFFREKDLARLPNISVSEYAEAATADFQRYIAFKPLPGAVWNAEFAEKVTNEFQRMLQS